MKKVFLIIFILFFGINVNAKEIVTLNKCVDGDTAWFNINDEKIKARFLAIDTPESTNKIEPYGKEASEFTCNLLKNAKKIEIEYDENSDKFDKYDRHLVWVFVDDELLQNIIVKEGYADVKYLYGDYKYTDILKKSLIEAKANNLNMWKSEENNITNNIYIISGIILLIIILYIFNISFRNKINKKIKSNIKKEIRKKVDI